MNTQKTQTTQSTKRRFERILEDGEDLAILHATTQPPKMMKTDTIEELKDRVKQIDDILAVQDAQDVDLIQERETLLETVADREQMKRNMEEMEKKLQNPDMKITNFLTFLLIIWEDALMRKELIPFLTKASKEALTRKMYMLKGNLYIWKNHCTTILETLRQKGSDKILYLDFVKLSQDGGYFTTFSKDTLTEAETELLTDAWEHHTTARSSSSQHTTPTTTSCTTVPTAPPPAAASESKKSETPSNATEESLFRADDTASSTGTIQQSISRREGDGLTTFKSPGESGDTVWKLEERI